MPKNKGIFHAYGLFWRRDEIDWTPGRGNGSYSLLGRRGQNRNKLRMADFRRQHGIYILYGDYGQYYVGLTRTQGLGKRLKNHLTDGHGKNWDRFSWFSFGRVLKNRDAHGLQCFARLPPKQSLTSNSVIGDIEALLIQIQAMSLQNSVKMKFAQAERWTQVKLNEVETYRKRLR